VELIGRLEGGATIALVSDAGTPLVSDPGFRLVTAAIAAGIAVVPVPGPSAVATAVTAAGLPTDSYRFCGFLPPKSQQRRKVLEQLKHETCTLVFFETPHRILDALEDVAAVMGPRPVVAARELTKVHEEFLRGTASAVREQLAERPSIRGEFTLLIGKAGMVVETDETPLAEAVEELERQGLARMDAIKQVAKARGMSKRECYRQLTSS
jgi:16S rRNA (cytidine1402-2'-O)-methyltransferase